MGESATPGASDFVAGHEVIATPRWMAVLLILAGVYNLAWGTFIIIWPSQPFAWFGMAAPNYPQLWQCIGMIVGVYGLGYVIAAADPVRHWPIVLVGLLGKLFGPIGFVEAAWRGELPWIFGVTCLTNDLIWWFPFVLILRHAAQVARRGEHADLSFEQVLKATRTADGKDLYTLSHAGPVLLVFLRHFG